MNPTKPKFVYLVYRYRRAYTVGTILHELIGVTLAPLVAEKLKLNTWNDDYWAYVQCKALTY